MAALPPAPSRPPGRPGGKPPIPLEGSWFTIDPDLEQELVAYDRASLVETVATLVPPPLTDRNELSVRLMLDWITGVNPVVKADAVADDEPCWFAENHDLGMPMRVMPSAVALPTNAISVDFTRDADGQWSMVSLSPGDPVPSVPYDPEIEGHELEVAQAWWSSHAIVETGGPPLGPPYRSTMTRERTRVRTRRLLN